MGIHITQEAVIYLILMLVVVFIGIAFVVGGDIKALFSGSSPFEAPSIKVTKFDFQGATCEFNRFVLRINTIKIHYFSSRQPNEVEVYPVLDIGNNPLLDESEAEPKRIKCTVRSEYSGLSENQYDCPAAESLKYSVRLVTSIDDSLDDSFDMVTSTDDSNLVSANTPIQMYFFRKTDAIRDYINNRRGTTAKLLETFTDFYINSYQMDAKDTRCLAGTAIG